LYRLTIVIVLHPRSLDQLPPATASRRPSAARTNTCEENKCRSVNAQSTPSLRDTDRYHLDSKAIFVTNPHQSTVFTACCLGRWQYVLHATLKEEGYALAMAIVPLPPSRPPLAPFISVRPAARCIFLTTQEIDTGCSLLTNMLSKSLRIRAVVRESHGGWCRC
jgi:hypothetical protein